MSSDAMYGPMEAGLLAANAAWSCAGVYGVSHATVRAHAERAADHFRTAAGHRDQAVALVRADRVIAEDRTLASGHILRAGLFARVGSTHPDCVRVSPTTTASDVQQFIEILSQSGPRRAGCTIGGITLSWAGSDSTAHSHVSSVTARTPCDYVENLGGAWNAAAGLTEEDPRTALATLEHMANEIAHVAANDGASLLPLAHLKLHDEYTFVHAVNVGLITSALCAAAGLSADITRAVTIGGMLHDVGKRAMPAAVINKPGKLSQTERAILNGHPEAGVRLLAGSHGVPPVVLAIAYEHHMNIDGSGYPKPPKGWTVPVTSQIVHIADVFDALRTHRPYRKAMDVDTALGIMTEDAGRAYDRALFDVFADRVAGRVKPDAAPSLPASQKQSHAA